MNGLKELYIIKELCIKLKNKKINLNNFMSTNNDSPSFFLPPNDHSTRMGTVLVRFNRELRPFIEDRLEGAPNDQDIECAVRNLTVNVVMDMLTQEDIIYLSKLALARIFTDHINKILKKESEGL